MRDATAPLSPAKPRPPGLPRGLNILGTFAQHPDLAAAFWVFNGYILNRSTLTQRQTEMAILRVAVLCNSEYEWKQHVHIGRLSGISDDEIAAIEARNDAHAWSDADRALLATVDELVGGATVSEETWTALSAFADNQQVLDLIFTVGAYVTIAMMMGLAGTPLDDDLI